MINLNMTYEVENPDPERRHPQRSVQVQRLGQSERHPAAGRRALDLMAADDGALVGTCHGTCWEQGTLRTPLIHAHHLLSTVYVTLLLIHHKRDPPARARRTSPAPRDTHSNTEHTRAAPPVCGSHTYGTPTRRQLYKGRPARSAGGSHPHRTRLTRDLTHAHTPPRGRSRRGRVENDRPRAAASAPRRPPAPRTRSRCSAQPASPESSTRRICRAGVAQARGRARALPAGAGAPRTVVVVARPLTPRCTAARCRRPPCCARSCHCGSSAPPPPRVWPPPRRRRAPRRATPLCKRGPMLWTRRR